MEQKSREYVTSDWSFGEVRWRKPFYYRGRRVCIGSDDHGRCKPKPRLADHIGLSNILAYQGFFLVLRRHAFHRIFFFFFKRQSFPFNRKKDVLSHWFTRDFTIVLFLVQMSFAVVYLLVSREERQEQMRTGDSSFIHSFLFTSLLFFKRLFNCLKFTTMHYISTYVSALRMFLLC